MLFEYLRPSLELCWKWIFPWIKLSWHSCSIWEKLELFNWFWQFFNLFLIWKDSITSMHGVTVYVKEGLPFAQDLSLENSVNFYVCFQLPLLHLVSCLFFLYQSCSLPLCFFWCYFIWHRWSPLNQLCVAFGHSNVHPVFEVSFEIHFARHMSSLWRSLACHRHFFLRIAKHFLHSVKPNLV